MKLLVASLLVLLTAHSFAQKLASGYYNAGKDTLNSSWRIEIKNDSLIEAYPIFYHGFAPRLPHIQLRYQIKNEVITVMPVKNADSVNIPAIAGGARYFSDTLTMTIKNKALIDYKNEILFVSRKHRLKQGVKIDDKLYYVGSGALTRKLNKSIKEQDKYKGKVVKGFDAYIISGGKCEAVVVYTRN